MEQQKEKEFKEKVLKQFLSGEPLFGKDDAWVKASAKVSYTSIIIFEIPSSAGGTLVFSVVKPKCLFKSNGERDLAGGVLYDHSMIVVAALSIPQIEADMKDLIQEYNEVNSQKLSNLHMRINS